MPALRSVLLPVALLPLLARCGPVHVRDTDESLMHPKIACQARSKRDISYNIREKDADFWRARAREQLETTLEREPLRQVARSAVLFLGDGMSVPTLAAARILLGQRYGLPGEEAQLSFERFPYAGLSKTYCVDAQVADSACSSTAYLCGVKANTGTMGVTAAVRRGDCRAQNNTANHVDSILKWAQAAGKATGIVTTSRVTHASPGGGYAHIADREWENDADVSAAGADPAVCPDIASQLVTAEPGRNLKVIMGGGRREFRPKTSDDEEEGGKGRRKDGRDLIEEWKADKSRRGSSSKYVWNKDQLLQNDTVAADYILGLFEDSHMQYHLDANPETEPRLWEMTEVAIRALQKEPNGFILFVEGARIDMAHHSNRAHKALDETIEFSEAIRVADQLTDERDTLLVVTADHAHTMSFNGYPARGNDILGDAGTDEEKLSYTTLSYANGPGYQKPGKNCQRPDIREDDKSEKNYRFRGMVPLGSETHGGDDVAVLSRGPWSHLLTGVFEQNYIAHAMAYATCVGDGLTACNDKRSTSGRRGGLTSTPGYDIPFREEHRYEVPAVYSPNG
ncbi:membrane-bound alkaline phosphatase-like [Schistocerca cancellata]|uniref:membrane-bound alkaline phosphatase-like n=1 Tax=Schistocerca cancellata TaxID=274614 RepID=UPI00211969FA|nr:membrane-bound alkaline phosphatase-like [Schistocerca cancellata]